MRVDHGAGAGWWLAQAAWAAGLGAGGGGKEISWRYGDDLKGAVYEIQVHIMHF